MDGVEAGNQLIIALKSRRTVIDDKIVTRATGYRIGPVPGIDRIGPAATVDRVVVGVSGDIVGPLTPQEGEEVQFSRSTQRRIIRPGRECIANSEGRGAIVDRDFTGRIIVIDRKIRGQGGEIQKIS